MDDSLVYLFLVLIVGVVIFHFGLILLLGILKETVFLFVKNKQQNIIYKYFDYLAPIVVSLLYITILFVVGLIVFAIDGLNVLFSKQGAVISILFLIELILFFLAFNEYKSVKKSNKIVEKSVV